MKLRQVIKINDRVKHVTLGYKGIVIDIYINMCNEQIAFIKTDTGIKEVNTYYLTN